MRLDRQIMSALHVSRRDRLLRLLHKLTYLTQNLLLIRGERAVVHPFQVRFGRSQQLVGRSALVRLFPARAARELNGRVGGSSLPHDQPLRRAVARRIGRTRSG